MMIEKLASIAPIFAILVSLLSLVVTARVYIMARKEIDALKAKGGALPPSPDVSDPESEIVEDTGEADENA